MTVFFLNATSFGNTIGDLWEFCGLSVAFLMRLYHDAAKIFGTEGILCRRFVNFAIKRRLKQAEGVDYQRLPLGCFFVIFFLSAESCAEVLISSLKFS